MRKRREDPLPDGKQPRVTGPDGGQTGRLAAMLSEFRSRPLWHVQRLLIGLNLVACAGLVVLVLLARDVLFSSSPLDRSTPGPNPTNPPPTETPVLEPDPDAEGDASAALTGGAGGSEDAECGDGFLAASEECEPLVCQEDAPQSCVQDVGCDSGETCSADTCTCEPVPLRPTPTMFSVTGLCGNGICNAGENAATCPADCGSAVGQPRPAGDGSDGTLCGDGICQSGESPRWCGDCYDPRRPEESECPECVDPTGADGRLCGDGICQPAESPDWCGDCPA